MLILTPFFLSVLAAATSSPTSHLVIEPCLAGERQQFETVPCEIALRNSGDKPVHITDARSVFEWDSIDPKVTVPAHGAAYLKATIATRDAVGFSKHSFRITTDEPGVLSQRGASVHVFVSTVLDQAAPALDFGAVKLSAGPVSKEIALSSREVPDFRILGIASKPDYVDAVVGTDGKTLRASISKNAPWGLVHDKIKLKINAPQQPEAWVTVDANVIGEIAANGNPFAFGLMRTNAKNEFLIRLTSESGKDFKIGSAKPDHFEGKVDVVPCTPEAAGCRMLHVLVSNEQQQGRLQGKILVDLPEFKRVLPVDVVGMLLAPEVKVHDLNKELEKATDTGGASQASATVPGNSIDLKQAISRTAAAAETAAPPGDGPLLRWAVANDGSVYGYIIYRADDEHGPFLRVNKELIRAGGGSPKEGVQYQWRDDSAVSGHTYWYQIGMVKNNGEKQPLSGAQKVTAK
ncbi:hypothetical protein [Dokdonella sp.]|uniref:hypothetical protein n=1 Tax=Dokdonella sp. TaxID=2291710 RepID=UPI002F4105DF